MQNWLITTRPKSPEFYDGILIHADTGMHEQAMKLFQRHVAAGASVLDVGAGSGAFSKRLSDSGYRVTALDVDEQKWAAPQVPFFHLDIDKGLRASIDGTFDSVCCLEVIEHVESPWQLLRDISSLLPQGGRALISTPNVTSFLSRLGFLINGRFHQFGDDDVEYGHVSPITDYEFKLVAARTGWRVLATQPGGYLPVFDFSSRSPRNLLFNILRGIAYLVARGEKRGWCLFFVIEKTDTT